MYFVLLLMYCSPVAWPLSLPPLPPPPPPSPSSPPFPSLPSPPLSSPSCPPPPPLFHSPPYLTCTSPAVSRTFPCFAYYPSLHFCLLFLLLFNSYSSSSPSSSSSCSFSFWSSSYSTISYSFSSSWSRSSWSSCCFFSISSSSSSYLLGHHSHQRVRHSGTGSFDAQGTPVSFPSGRSLLTHPSRAQNVAVSAALWRTLVDQSSDEGLWIIFRAQSGSWRVRRSSCNDWLFAGASVWLCSSLFPFEGWTMLEWCEE